MSARRASTSAESPVESMNPTCVRSIHTSAAPQERTRSTAWCRTATDARSTSPASESTSRWPTRISWTCSVALFTSRSYLRSTRGVRRAVSAVTATPGGTAAPGGNQTAVPPLFADIQADERGVRRGLRSRRAILTLLLVVPLLALADRFGQRATESGAGGARAPLARRAPATVRGGLFFQSRVTVRARTRIQHPRLVLDQGWAEG